MTATTNTSAENTMLAALCDGPGQPLQMRRLPIPQPRPGQLLVKMESCGICHSDIHIRDGQEPVPEQCYPIILGHEGIGRITQTGPDTPTGFQIGDRVGLPWLYSTCGDCRPCLTGQETFCPDQTARGIHHHGAFAEYALMQAEFAFKIPDSLDPIQAAPLLCAGVTAWSALRKTRMSAGSRVLVIGAGGLGQYALLIAKLHGAQVLVVDPDQRKRAIAKQAGADLAIPPGPEAGPAIQAAGGADIVVNFAPTADIWRLVETAVNPMSDIVVVAMVYDPVALSMMWLINNGHRVFGSSVATRQETRDFLHFAQRNPLPVDVESVPLGAAEASLNRLKSGAVRCRLCIDFSLESPA